jgi:hypothetical protein
VGTTLELTGSGLAEPMGLTFDELVKLPFARLDEVLMLKTHEDDELTSWQGPALSSVLDAARIKPGPMTVSLEAEDGYKTEVEIGELEGAIIAVQDGEGRWLSDTNSDCVLKLVPPHLPGNFWVLNISRIRVEPAGENAS